MLKSYLLLALCCLSLNVRAGDEIVIEDGDLKDIAKPVVKKVESPKAGGRTDTTEAPVATESAAKEFVDEPETVVTAFGVNLEFKVLQAIKMDAGATRIILTPGDIDVNEMRLHSFSSEKKPNTLQLVTNSDINTFNEAVLPYCEINLREPLTERKTLKAGTKLTPERIFETSTNPKEHPATTAGNPGSQVVSVESKILPGKKSAEQNFTRVFDVMVFSFAATAPISNIICFMKVNIEISDMISGWVYTKDGKSLSYHPDVKSDKQTNFRELNSVLQPFFSVRPFTKD